MEELSLIQGLQIALYGFITVFVMLSFLMILINVMSKIVASIENKKVVEEEIDLPTQPVVVVEDNNLPKQYVGELQLIDVDEKTAACIMAIISEESKIPLENLIFKRIQLIKEEN